MTYWKAVRLLTGQLWRREWLGMSATVVVALYMGSLLSLNLNAMFTDEKIPEGLRGFVDWIYLLLMPCLGMVMNRTIFTMWRDDSYTKRLGLYRAYPIPTSAVVGSRFTQFLILVPVNTTIALALEYAMSPDMRNAVTGVRWFEFAVIWTCYSLIVNAAFVLLELGVNGKRFVQGYLAWYGFITVLVVALTLAGIHPFIEVLKWTESDYAPASVAIAVACAVLAIRAGYRATIKRIANRSISF